MDKPVKKYLAHDYRKNGNEFFEYMIEDTQGNSKTIKPAHWKRLELPDATSDYNAKLILPMLVKKMKFQQQIDWNCHQRKLALGPRELLQEYQRWTDGNW